MDKISWDDLVRNAEVLHRVKEERDTVEMTKRGMASWIGHILCRNSFLKHFIEGYKGREEEEEYVSSYKITLRKREDTVN